MSRVAPLRRSPPNRAHQMLLLPQIGEGLDRHAMLSEIFRKMDEDNSGTVRMRSGAMRCPVLAFDAHEQRPV